MHLCKIKLIEIGPDKKLVYHILDDHFNFIQDKTEWIDTKLKFEITTEGDNTKVKFTHEGLNPSHECYKVCHDSWGNYINKSLYRLIMIEKGMLNPLDPKGFNAEIVEKWKLKS